MAFDAVERNGRFGRIQCQRDKESSSRGRRKKRVFLCRWTVKIKVGDKPIPASFLKTEGRGDARWGDRPEREGRIEELVSGQNPGPEGPPRSRKRQENREQKEMSGEERLPEERWRKVGVSETLRGRRSEEMTQSNTSSPRGSEVSFESQRG